jgi:hypothetical protein
MPNAQMHGADATAEVLECPALPLPLPLAVHREVASRAACVQLECTAVPGQAQHRLGELRSGWGSKLLIGAKPSETLL